MSQSNMYSDKETSMLQLKKRVQKFIEDRDWEKYHKPKNLAMSIAIEASELMELFQWTDDTESDAIAKHQEKLAALQDELADIMAYCISLANVLNIDIAQSVMSKIDKNEDKYPVEEFKGFYKKPPRT